MSKTLIETLLEEGYPKEQMFHHESDLYIFVTPLTIRVIEKWYKDNGFDRQHHAPMFIDQITGRIMYDCYFQYYTEDAKGRRI